MEQNQISDKVFNVEIDMIARDHLKTITTWARLIALIAFINIGLTLLGTLIQPGVSGTMGLVALVFFMLIYLVVVVLLNIFLLRFANNTANALNTQSQDLFNLGINNLGIYFKILGIMVIVVLSILAVFLILYAIGVALQGSSQLVE